MRQKAIRHPVALVTFVALSIAILYFSLYPVLAVVINSVMASVSSAAFFSHLRASRPFLKNSLEVAMYVTPMATLLGTIIAFTLERVPFFGRRLFRLFSMLPLISPPFIGSIAYIMLFGRRGLITHRLLGLSVSPFGRNGILVMQIMGMATVAYLLIASSLKRMDTSLEEAARNLGMSEEGVLLRVTLPMMRPAIAAAALLTFLASMADFGTPMIIGGAYQTLASQLYIQITGLYRVDRASVFGLVLLIPCLLAFALQRKVTRLSSYHTTAPLSTAVAYTRLPAYLKGLLISITVMFTTAMAAKYFFIIAGAFTELWGHDFSLTTRHFFDVWQRSYGPYKNSIMLSVTVAFLASLLGIVLAYLCKRRNYRLAATMDFVATMPAAVPGILFGVGYLVAFSRPPFILLGTVSIVYIISIARTMNISLRAGDALLEQLDPDLENASFNLGMGEARTMLKVVLPLLKPAFYMSFIRIMTSVMTTLGAIILLLVPRNKVAVQVIFSVLSSSELGKAAAMAVMLSLTSGGMLLFFTLLFYGPGWLKTRLEGVRQ